MGDQAQQSSKIEVSIDNSTSAVLTSAGDETAKMQSPDDQIISTVIGGGSKMDTTQFVDDGDVMTTDKTHMVTMSKTITMMGQPQASETSLLDFLKKPIALTKANFSTSDTFSVFNSISMPYAAFAGTSGLIWRQKLAGFFGIRMNMRFRIVVNANKFQAGRYIMGWTPLGGAAQTISNLKNVNFIYAHNASLVQRTTVPHVEVDLATMTTAELVVPFACAYKFYPLNTILSSSDYCPLGSLNVYPYSVLSAPTGNTSCGYTIYVSLEEVSLYGAAAAQGGRKGPSYGEISNKANGPVSGIANAISRGFKEFKNIPLLGEYATGVSWIADRVSNVASVFGFSKPTVGDTQPRMQIVNAPCHSTVDGESDARALSYMSSPGVVPIQGLSGTDYDEMDFSFIKSKYAWYRTVQWTTSQVADIIVTSINVDPLTGQNNVGGAFNFTPIAYLARHFTWWRGSLKFRFKVVKTEYHSGRLQFAFYPNDENTYQNSESFVNRVIVDMREHSEVELVIPYLARTPWTEAGTRIGQIYVQVVDPLVAPPTVNASIDILMEIAGGDDFEVAAVRTFEHITTRIVPQGGDEDNVKNIVSTTIGDMEVKSNPILMSSLCIGDKVTNLRAYLKRYCAIEKLGANTGSTMNTTSLTLYPDAVTMLADPTSVPVDYFSSDFISNWASCYLFMSGGIRIRNVIDNGLRTTDSLNSIHTSTVAALDTVVNVASSTIILDATPRVGNTCHRVLQDCSSNNTITVEVPQYTSTFTRCIPDIIIYQGTTMNTSNYYTGGKAATAATVKFFTPAGAAITSQTGQTLHRIFRAGADDFNLSGFISIPPFITNSNSNKTGFY